MPKRDWIEQRQLNIDLINTYSNFMPYCIGVSQRVSLSQEIIRLANQNKLIDSTPLSECLEGKELYLVRLPSKINDK